VGLAIVAGLLLGVRFALPIYRMHRAVEVFQHPAEGGITWTTPTMPAGYYDWLRRQLSLLGIDESSPLAGLDRVCGVSIGAYQCSPLKASARMALLPDLPDLTRIELRGVPITDDDLRHLTTLTQLEILDLSDTPITGSGLRYLAVLPKLRELNLSGTHIDDANLAPLVALSHLDELSLDHTAMTDEAIATLRQLRALKTLTVSDTAISDEGIATLEKSVPGISISDD
jgi:Leucine-rich repeat (LRR) protein